MKPYTEPQSISAADWVARQQGENDARIAEIRRNLNLDGDIPSFQVRAGEDDGLTEPSHFKRPGARPVVSDRGERFKSSEDAAYAMGRSCNGVRLAIQTGGTCAGRAWKYDGPAPRHPKPAKKARGGRAVVDEFGNRFESISDAAKSLNMSNGGWLSQSIERGWRVAGRHWFFADKEAA